MRGVFFIKIIIPSILVIVLYVISFSMIFLPMVEKGFMDRKKEMIKELTNSAWSIIDEYYQEIDRQNFSEEMAREMAINRVEFIRYGDEGKDYFWITNMVPEMIMHPYRPDLNGMNVYDYADPHGTRLFAEAVEMVRIHGEGYIDYYWQWKDDSTRIVPKLSYVKGFEPWGWIVATGIYLEDVKEEMGVIRSGIIRISLLFVVIISIIIFYITRQSLIIERSRIDAEEKLKHSRLKYKMLVESSTESTMIWLDNKLHYYNQAILQQTQYTDEELQGKEMDELFIIPDGSIRDVISNILQTRNVEALLVDKQGKKMEVVVTISAIDIYSKRGYIFIIKEVTRQLIRDKSTHMLQEDLKSSLLMMNMAVKLVSKRAETIDMDRTMAEAAVVMSKKQTSVLFVTKNRKDIVGILKNDAFVREVLTGNASHDTRVFQHMHSPVIYIKESHLIFQALSIMEKEGVDFLAVKDGLGYDLEYVTRNDLLQFQHNVSATLIQKIEEAEKIEQLQALYDRLPALLAVLLDSDSFYQHVARITVAISDAITKRVIELAIEKNGSPPVGFAFLALGSDGREEQTLKTDQDNAIVYEDSTDKRVVEYFHRLATVINDSLNEIGYEYCKGKVMASTYKWCQPVSKWKAYFREWIENSDPENILDTSIFFDLRYVYGERALVDELNNEIAITTRSQSVFFSNLARSVMRLKAVTFSEKQEHLDLKKAMMPVVGFARLYALKYEVNETNTINRLLRVIDSGKVSRTFIEDTVHSYRYLLILRFRNQINKILSGSNPDNIISSGDLTNIDKATLKAALLQITELFTQMNFDFETS